MTSRTLIKMSSFWNYMPPTAISCHIEEKKTVRMMSNLGAFYLWMNCLFPNCYMFATWFASGEKSPGGITSLHLYERHLIFLLFFHCTFTLLKSCLSLHQIILIIENRIFFLFNRSSKEILGPIFKLFIVSGVYWGAIDCDG